MAFTGLTCELNIPQADVTIRKKKIDSIYTEKENRT